jgi:arylsulfatase
MQNKNLLFILILFLFTISCTNRVEEKKLPNVVVIFIDDMGYADVGCFGATGYETPNIDKMADEGMRFTSFYSSTGVCSASRASLMTGCYCDRISIHGAFMPDAKRGLNPDETTIAEMLKPLGYKTAIFGKWHLGHHKEFLPLQQGFDEYFGIPYSNDMWPVDYDGIAVKDKENPTKPRKRRFPPLPLIEGNEKVKEVWTLEEQGELTTMYTERAVDFINRNKENPFFLYLPHSMVHVPIAVSEKFKGKSKQGLFGDVVMEVDWSVGEILKALKANGIAENTLVIFTSDNGPWLNFGNHAGSAKPLREGKGTVWEGGHREPCVMWWPGKIAPGKTIDKIASTIDILPTIAEMTGAKLPEKKIDGISFLPVLNGEDVTTRDEFWCYYGGGLRAIRKGDWKMYYPQTYRSYLGVKPGKDGFPGPYAKGVLDKIVLYNLKNDISETKDVSAEYPEIVKQLKKIGDRARKELGDNITKVKGEEVRAPGEVL